ncbi:hypothetical protein J2X19_001769 [Rhodoferax ferrireducens]|uniref:Serine protease n=1 Tax=Rhodoferax ferrireducens TaxID=192843 RepID=A0ABU2C703_9BURK|nr:trypsin-like serine protease [Rhodoferax ferrireducens]MDR7377111.1 hypothetical protein [Rhodoferax ferrireducens]
MSTTIHARLRCSIGRRLLPILLLSSADTWSQPAPIPRDVVPYQATSGVYDGQLLAVVADTREVRIANAPWLQLHFKAYELGAESFITVTSIADGGVQILNARTLDQWRSNSAYFNGDAVKITLHPAPGDKGVFYSLDGVVIGAKVEPSAHELRGPMALCGTDDRVHSNDPRSARIVPVGCTGWLVSTGAVLTAGHCTDPLSELAVLEFNVPASTPDGSIRFASPANQYAIDAKSVVASEGEGNDWAIFTTHANPNTHLFPATAQKAFYRMSSNLMTFGTGPAQVQVTGYGVDNTPPGIKGGRNAQNQTEQTDVGLFLGEDEIDPHKVVIKYRVDTMGGNSGSPVIYPGTDITIGIHTHGGCGIDPATSNQGTGFKNQQLEGALQQFLTFFAEQVTYVDGGHASGAEENGRVFKPYRRLEDAVAAAANGDILSMTSGFYAGWGITFPKGKELRLRATAGPVGIGASPRPQ